MSDEAHLSISRLSVLACYAHPDDEGFASGGLLAMLAAGGARVTLVCATNGDIGEISDPALATPENLWQVRKQELRDAMDITGISDVRFLDYRDSGMEGWDDNHHPNAYCNADTGAVVERLRSIITEVNAHVVITHDPTGGYGHPDHKTMCAHATAAAERASDPDAATPLLYYVCFPRSVFQRMWQEMTDRGITPPFAVDAVDTLGTPDNEVTTTLDISSWVETKIASLSCHRTQISSDGPFAQLPPEVMRRLMGTEYYQLAAPAGASDLLSML